jgi:DNA (cytosine-5)-methyltransferase 1
VNAVASHIPADATRLIDVFMGSGTVSLKLADRFQTILMTDVNPDLVGFMRAAMHTPEALISEAAPLFAVGMKDKSTYLHQRTLFNRTQGARTPARFLYLNRHCYGGMIRYNQSWGFNTAAGNRKSSVFPVENIRGLSKRLPHAVVELADFRVTMQKAGAGDVVIADPPYLDSTITYTAGGFGKQEQTDLAHEALQAAARGATVIIFNNDTPAARVLYAQASEIASLSIQRKLGEHKKVPEVMAIYRPVAAAQVVATPKIESAPAANDKTFNGFNKDGYIDEPQLAVAYEDKGNIADATLWAHPVDGKWYEGFDFAFRSGQYQAETLLPAKLDKGYDTASLAIESAAVRLLSSLDAKFPDLGVLVKAEANQVSTMRGWMNAQIEVAHKGGFEPKPAFIFIDLFAGIGGFHGAMKQVGGKCALACEINEESRKTYLANHDMTGVPFAADITQLEAALVPDHDVLCAGFPCQAFSIAGGKHGFDDQRGGLIFDMLRIIEAKRPKLLLLENVKNFCSGEGGKWSRTLRRRLAGMGYAVTAKVLNAADFGTPQERERVFFVAYRRDAFADVQGFQMPVGDGKWISVADILEADAPDGHYGADQIEPCPTVDKSSPLQRVGMLKSRDGTVRHGQDARVYDPAFHATTLMATQDNCGVYLVNGKARSLTPRERARLQGFPDTFKPHPVKTHANKQFGNSIAVPVAAAIGHAINQQFFKQAA